MYMYIGISENNVVRMMLWKDIASITLRVWWCDKDVVRKTLWEKPCEKGVGRKTLWKRCCEKNLERKTLGEKPCEKGVVRNTLRDTLWERSYSMVLKPHNRLCTCFILRHEYSLTVGVRLGSAPSTMACYWSNTRFMFNGNLMVPIKIIYFVRTYFQANNIDKWSVLFFFAFRVIEMISSKSSNKQFSLKILFVKMYVFVFNLELIYDIISRYNVILLPIIVFIFMIV